MKKHRIKTSAPTKLILFGEHYVVYGAEAIAIPVDIRNSVSISTVGGEPKLEIETSKTEKNSSPEYEFLQTLFQFIIENNNFELKETLHAQIGFGGAPKGMGNSASISAALALALFEYFGKKPTREELFEAVQVAEQIAHSGKSSGIDGHTVIDGKPISYRRFEKPAVRCAKIALPKGTSLLVVDTSKGKTSTTAEMVSKFAKNKKITKKPSELSSKEQEEICREYDELLKKIKKELREDGSSEKLGKLMSENHQLLANAGVSDEGIEIAIQTCLEAGAYGAKLTGAGGEGGAVIALILSGKEKEVKKKIGEAGFKALTAKLADRGVG